MNCLSVSTTGLKEPLGDFMDLATCAVNGVTAMDDLESSEINMVDWSRH